MPSHWAPTDEGDCRTEERPKGDLDRERLDALFSALADERRRRVLRYFLHTGTDAASVADLVEYVAERSDDGRPREELAAEFHHVALPALQAADLVTYDERAGEVRYRGHPLAEGCLRLAADASRV